MTNDKEEEVAEPGFKSKFSRACVHNNYMLYCLLLEIYLCLNNLFQVFFFQLLNLKVIFKCSKIVEDGIQNWRRYGQTDTFLQGYRHILI